MVLQDVVEEHRATLDRDNPRDIIDSYLIEMEERKDDPDSTFSGKYSTVSNYIII